MFFDEEYRDIWLNIRLSRLLAVLVQRWQPPGNYGAFATQWLTGLLGQQRFH